LRRGKTAWRMTPHPKRRLPHWCASTVLRANASIGKLSPRSGPRGGPRAPLDGEERRLVSVLFVGLSGPVGTGGRSDPEDLRQLVGEALAAVITEVEGLGGTVASVSGTGLVALFGAPEVFHGHGGELRQPYREGQEDQLGALGLVVNAIALWNTRYMTAALDHLRATEGDVNTDDVERLSPLRHDHINLHGRYNFTPSAAVDRGELRSLEPTIP
jgi:class 3 adenylate cyclase